MSIRKTQCIHKHRYSSINGEICDDCGDVLTNDILDTSPSSGSQPSHREKRLRRLLSEQLHQPSRYVNEVIMRFNRLIEHRSSRSMKQPSSYAVVLMLLYILYRENDKIYPIFAAARQINVETTSLRAAARKVSELYHTAQLPKITAVDIVESMLDEVNLGENAIKSIGSIYDILANDNPEIIISTELGIIAYGLLYFYLVDAVERDITYDNFLNTFDARHQRILITKIIVALRNLKIRFQHKQ